MWALVVAAVGVAQSSSLDSGSGSGSNYPANTQDDRCENFESYWVAFNDEAGILPYIDAMCVPTAAGNLITYLAAKQDSTKAYPYNYELDNYTISSDNWVVRTSPAQNPNEYYLGGQVFTDSTMPDFDLRQLMQWQVGQGVTISDGRTGLQKYLDKTNRLGKARVVGVDRPTNEYDYQFVKRYQPPYMLHIAKECLEDNDYAQENPNANLYVEGSPLEDFHGSELGHTIVVYEQTVKSQFFGDYILELEGASGIKVSRNGNKRGCDTTKTTLNDDQKCVTGLTYIEIENDNDGLSAGVVVAIVVGSVVVVGGVGAVVYYKWPKGLIAGNMAYAQFI